MSWWGEGKVTAVTPAFLSSSAVPVFFLNGVPGDRTSTPTCYQYGGDGNPAEGRGGEIAARGAREEQTAGREANDRRTIAP